MSKTKARDRLSKSFGQRSRDIHRNTFRVCALYEFGELALALTSMQPKHDLVLFHSKYPGISCYGDSGVDKNTDGWLKRSFNPASNELI